MAAAPIKPGAYGSEIGLVLNYKAMKLLQQLRQLERVDSLIRRKGTGSPEQLARRLDLSKRQVHRLINDLRAMGLPIRYCRERQSYLYASPVKWEFAMRVEQSTLVGIEGGSI